MPDLFEIMESCRAMRRLKPDPVPDELIAKILRAGIYAPNGGNTQKWRFLVVKDPKIKKAVQVIYKKAYDEVIGPRYSSSAPPPGSDKEKYRRQHAAVEYLTDHYHEAPVWIVACLEDGPTPNRMAGSSIYPAVQNMVLATPRAGARHDADDAAHAVREGGRCRARTAAGRALLRHPSHRLSDGQVRPGRARLDEGVRLPGQVGPALRGGGLIVWERGPPGRAHESSTPRCR